MFKEPIIIDCDPGVDDAVAIGMLLFSTKIKVELFSTSAGNLGLETCTRNMLDLLNFFGKDIPVAKGAKKPLKVKHQPATNAQGTIGFAGYELSKSDLKPIDKTLDEAYLEVLKKNGVKGTTILIITPSTNVAKFLSKNPDAKQYIKQIIFMGGTLEGIGNLGKTYNEFNIKNDPDALQILLSSGIEIVVIPMELGHYNCFDLFEIDKIRRTNVVGETYYKMFLGYADGHVKTGIAVHDACAATYLLNEKLFKTANVFAKVNFNAEPPTLSFSIGKNSLVKIALSINNKKFKKLFFSLLKKMKTK